MEILKVCLKDKILAQGLAHFIVVYSYVDQPPPSKHDPLNLYNDDSSNKDRNRVGLIITNPKRNK